MKAVLKHSQAKEPFSFTFVDESGKTIVRSENYTIKKNALNGIESVKKNCDNEKRYELKTAKNGKLFFNLKAANGQVIGTSPMYADESGRDNAIATLKAEGSSASLEEQS